MTCHSERPADRVGRQFPARTGPLVWPTHNGTSASERGTLGAYLVRAGAARFPVVRLHLDALIARPTWRWV
jgi:hypothetical protein